MREKKEIEMKEIKDLLAAQGFHNQYALFVSNSNGAIREIDLGNEESLNTERFEKSFSTTWHEFKTQTQDDDNYYVLDYISKTDNIPFEPIDDSWDIDVFEIDDGNVWLFEWWQ